MHPLNKPEVMIGNAHTKFDANGNLTDDDTRKHIRALLDALASWSCRFQSGSSASAR